ncbi:MAG: helix-turn-helix transcriptional regulator [Steroidobacteraceae bacterium]
MQKRAARGGSAIAGRRASRRPSGRTEAARPSSLATYFSVADALAALFSPWVEAVVHDLERDTVAHIANPFSPREAGDPSDLKEVHFAPDARVIGPYETITWDGRRIRAISVVLRDEASEPIGMLCVNADVTQFEVMRRTLQGLLGIAAQPGPDTSFQDDWHERINRFLASWTQQRATTLDRLDRRSRRELIGALFQAGGFEGRRSPAYVASVLGVSRATVYNELATLKGRAA